LTIKSILNEILTLLCTKNKHKTEIVISSQMPEKKMAVNFWKTYWFTIVPEVKFQCWFYHCYC